MDKQWSWNKVYFPAILVVGIGMLTARCEPTLLMAFLPQRMEMLKLLILLSLIWISSYSCSIVCIKVKPS